MPAGERFNSRNPGAAGPGQRFAPGYANPNRNYAPQNGARQQFPGSDHHMVNGQDRFRTPGQRGDFRAQGQRGDWRGQDRRGDWRGQDRRGDWRGRGERGQGWWRGQRGFERYEGRRDGFWFAPGYGYYRPDPRWYGYDWEIGVSVPYELRSYYISDPYAYDLPPAPYGCAWIYLGNELVMIDVQSGQIVQIAGQY
jgi:Ni/Co efflux regulator RcnB